MTTSDAAALLRATRASLGFTCSSRGLVSGCLYGKEPRGAMMNCRRQTYAIPGDPELIAKYVCPSRPALSIYTPHLSH